MRSWKSFCAAVAAALLTGCAQVAQLPWEDIAAALPPPAPSEAPAEQPAPESTPAQSSAAADAIPVDQVVWHGSISPAAWPAKYTLAVTIGGGKVRYEQQLTSEVDAVADEVSGRGTLHFAGNPWVILRLADGRWHGFTTEHLGARQKDKPTKTINGAHIKSSRHVPADWTPAPGQELYWMVSSNARNTGRAARQTAKVRTAIVRKDWP